MAGAAVGVVASTAAVTKLQSKRLDAGGVLLHNALVGRDDPTSLTRQEVVDIGQRYATGCLMPDAQAPSSDTSYHPQGIMDIFPKCPGCCCPVLLYALHTWQAFMLWPQLIRALCLNQPALIPAALRRVGGDLSLKLVDELKRMYDTYLESVVPPGSTPLK